MSLAPDLERCTGHRRHIPIASRIHDHTRVDVFAATLGQRFYTEHHAIPHSRPGDPGMQKERGSGLQQDLLSRELHGLGVERPAVQPAYLPDAVADF